MIILETALETAGLTYVFPDGNGIKNIAFQVKRGEIYALYGGHHAGKSVLLQTIIGTLRSQAGTLKLFGNIDYQKERRRIGFVPQKPVTIGSLSPADMLRYFSSVFGTTEIHILDILHLNLKEKKAVRRLPLSTQRLVNLAVALLGNPDMIILDDPFSALDRRTEDAVFKNLREYARDRIVLLISHRLYHFPEMDQIVFLGNGAAVTGTHQQLCDTVPAYRSLYESQTGGTSHEV